MKGARAMKIKVKTIIPLVSLAVGIVWIYYSLSEYGFWHPTKGPVVGFVPTLIAGVLVVVSILGVFQSFKGKDQPDRLENWAIFLAACIVFSFVFLLGMIISLLVFVFVWLKFYEKTGWKDTIIVLVISFAITYGVFAVWLKVPFPRGVIPNIIFG